MLFGIRFAEFCALIGHAIRLTGSDGLLPAPRRGDKSTGLNGHVCERIEVALRIYVAQPDGERALLGTILEDGSKSESTFRTASARMEAARNIPQAQPYGLAHWRASRTGESDRGS